MNIKKRKGNRKLEAILNRKKESQLRNMKESSKSNENYFENDSDVRLCGVRVQLSIAMS